MCVSNRRLLEKHLGVEVKDERRRGVVEGVVSGTYVYMNKSSVCTRGSVTSTDKGDISSVLHNVSGWASQYFLH